MPRVTLVFAVLLIIIGAIGYIGDSVAAPKGRNTEPQDLTSTGRDVERNAMGPKRSITALIPAFTGVLLLLFGGLAIFEKWRKHAMHAAVVIGLLGFIAAGGRAVTGLLKLADGGEVNMRSLTFVCAMAALCGVFVAMCINSFLQARRARQNEQAAMQG